MAGKNKKAKKKSQKKKTPKPRAKPGSTQPHVKLNEFEFGAKFCRKLTLHIRNQFSELSKEIDRLSASCCNGVFITWFSDVQKARKSFEDQKKKINSDPRAAGEIFAQTMFHVESPSTVIPSYPFISYTNDYALARNTIGYFSPVYALLAKNNVCFIVAYLCKKYDKYFRLACCPFATNDSIITSMHSKSEYRPYDESGNCVNPWCMYSRLCVKLEETCWACADEESVSYCSARCKLQHRWTSHGKICNATCNEMSENPEVSLFIHGIINSVGMRLRYYSLTYVLYIIEEKRVAATYEFDTIHTLNNIFPIINHDMNDIEQRIENKHLSYTNELPGQKELLSTYDPEKSFVFTVKICGNEAQDNDSIIISMIIDVPDVRTTYSPIVI